MADTKNKEAYTAKRVMQVERLINNRPVRKLNYLTLNQVFSKKIALIT